MAWVNGKDLNLLAAAPYHPFYAGMAAEASLAYNVLAGQPASAGTAQQAFAAAQATQRLQPKAVDPNTAKLAKLLGLHNGAPLSPTAQQALFPTH